MTAIFGIGVVAERADQVLNPVNAAGDLLHRGVVNLPIGFGERLLDGLDDDVGMGVGRGEDQRLAGQGRVDMFASSSATTRLKASVMTLLVELLDIETDFVGGMGQVDLAGRGC